MRSELLAAAQDIRAERYSDSEVAFLAGSLVRGEGTATSDLDIVVIYGALPNAYRESFRFGPWPVEAFVHDSATLKYFFNEVDRSSGIPSLASMVSEGLEVPESTELSRSLKQQANSALADGPPLWSQDEVDGSRYLITSLVDDLREPRSIEECTASATRLYEALANYYFRSRGLWSAHDKTIPRRLNQIDPDFCARFVHSFSDLFRGGDPGGVIDLAEEVLSPQGGWLFEGFTSTAPARWRST